jgi:hypothetical protein
MRSNDSILETQAKARESIGFREVFVHEQLGVPHHMSREANIPDVLMAILGTLERIEILLAEVRDAK